MQVIKILSYWVIDEYWAINQAKKFYNQGSVLWSTVK